MSNRRPKLYISRSKLKKAAETATHISLRLDLKGLAKADGFEKEVTITGIKPDVFLELKEKRNRYWFVGDAKVAENERPSHRSTAKKISRYIRVFAIALDLKAIRGGFIAIATDTKAAAVEWQEWLNRRCLAEGIVGPDESDPDFKITKIRKGAYVIFW